MKAMWFETHIQYRPHSVGASQQTQGSNSNQFTPVYDADGQLLEDASRSYQWDANGNLTRITNKATGHITDITYDGLGRRVQIQEKDNATTAPTVSTYQWCGSDICQKIDGNKAIVAEYFSQGEIQANPGSNLMTNTPGIKLLYQKDRLGSIRGITTPDGLQQGSRTYTAYGQTDQSSGMQPERGYAGMFRHEASGLYLTQYRAYDPEMGRWLSRDPIEEQGGINLYGYVEGDPVNNIDPQGRAGMFVYFGGYSVATGLGFSLPLGHAGVVAIDSKTGATQYFDFGRYGGEYGDVRGPFSVGTVLFDSNGMPTQASLDAIKAEVSQNFGKGNFADTIYNQDADANKIIGFALDRQRNVSQYPYTINPFSSYPINTCVNFAWDAFQAGSK